MALRPIASGTISFGLVAIPIKLFSTGESASTVRFNFVHKSCGSRVKSQYYCPTDDRIVERDELAKGYEYSKGQYVLFTPEELKALTPEPTHAIEITEFLPLEQIDPIYFEKAYYLGPDKGGPRPYRLLADVMRQTQRAALATYCARGKNYLVLLRPFREGLIMQQLRYADEIRDFGEVPLGEAELKDGELELALQLVDHSTAEQFEPEKYEDTVRKEVWAMIERKIEGQEIVAAPQESPKAQVVDLMEALKASLGEGDGEDAGRKPAKKRAEAEEPAAEEETAVSAGG